MAIHLGWLLPATSSNLPGHRYRIAPVAQGNACPYMVLLRMGFTMPVLLPVGGALTTPFTLTGISVSASGGLFSVAFPWGCPRRALPGILILWSPDFPLLFQSKAAAIRSSDRRTIRWLCQHSRKRASRLGRFGLAMASAFSAAVNQRLPFRLCRFAWLPIDRPAC